MPRSLRFRVGRWTTYGELAQLGGTAAMPVGQHVANAPGLDNAYRVLGARREATARLSLEQSR